MVVFDVAVATSAYVLYVTDVTRLVNYLKNTVKLFIYCIKQSLLLCPPNNINIVVGR